MADAICSTYGKSSSFLSHYTAPKPFFVTPSVSFHHSIHTKRTRKRRPPLHFACLCSSSSHFDVISTHEHSDGSFLFRFGDPSEVVKNDPVEETNLGVEGKGSDDEEDFCVVKIMDSHHRREVRLKKIVGEEKSEDSSELVDVTNQVVESESRSVSGIESASGEASSSNSVGIQVLASGLSLDIGNSSELTEQVDGVLHKRGNTELNNSVESDVEDFFHVDGSIEENGSSGSGTQVENAVFGEECIVENDGYESPATMNPCLPDHAFGPEDQGASAEIVQPLSGKIEEFIPLELNHVVEVNRVSDNLKEQLIKNDVDQREAWLNWSLSEHGSRPEDHGYSAEITESLTGRNQEFVSAELDAFIEVPADNVGKEISQEKFEVSHISNNVDAEYIEAGTQNNTIGDSSKSEIVEMRTLFSPLEAEPTPHEEGNAKIVEVSTQNDIMGEDSEIGVIETLPLSPPLEAETVLGKDEGSKSVQVETQDDILGGSCEREVIGSLPVSQPLGAEPVLDQGGSSIGEVGSHNDEKGSCDEIEGVRALLLSPSSEVEPVLEEREAKVVVAGTQNDVTGVSCESEAIGALSPPLVAEPFFDEEGDAGGAKVVEAKTQNDVTGVSSESEAIPALPLSPPLDAEPFLNEEGDSEKVECGTENDIKGVSSESEVQPVPDNEAELAQTEILDTSLRRATAIMIDVSSEVTEVEEVNKEIVGTDEPADSSGSDKTVSKPITLGLQSEKVRLEKLFLSSGSASLPHPKKALAGEEDACFTFQNWVGVADGVPRWSLEGVDHGKYAQEVMEIAREIVSGSGEIPVTSPEEVLNLAIAQARYPGSSTVLISHFDGKDLHVANIGDSGVVILRNGAVCQRSSPMFHEYNFPVLVESEDDPSRLVERYKFYLDEGDVVVAATDGLLDNLYEQEIISTVSKSLEADKNPKEIAEILATRAQEVGSSRHTRSPFSDAAQAAGYTGCTGGKLDDVVVVVSLVKKGFDSCES